jgi:DNA processing protein
MLALTLTPNLGPKRIVDAIAQLETPGAAQFIFDGKARRAADEEWAESAQQGATIITLAMPGVSRVAERDLRYVAGAVGSQSRATAVASVYRGGRHAPSFSVWRECGRDAVARSCEMPKGTFPAPQNFPRRNRIISGLSIGVLMMESRENSFTRVTPRCALEQDRDFYAVPGNVTAKNSNTLIKQGAKLVGSWEDVSDNLLSQVHLQLEQEAGLESISAAAASVLVDPVQRSDGSIASKALRADESLEFDELLEKLETQLTSSEVFTALFELELSGRIRCLPGKNYVRNLSL